MHADVGERPIRTAFTGLATPAGGRTAGLPILQVGAVQQMQPSGLPGSHARPGLAHRRVEPVDERHRRHPVARRGGQRARIGKGCRQRLLANHRLAGGKGAVRQRRVQRVRGADVHHVNVVGGDQFLSGGGRSQRAQSVGSSGGPLRGGRRHPRHHPASGAHGMGVHGADEPGSDYPRAHLVSHHFLRASATATIMKRSTMICRC